MISIGVAPELLLVRCTFAFLVVLGSFVTWRLLVGGIVTRGLLRDSHSGRFSPLRLQMLLSTLMLLGDYLRGLSALPSWQALPQPSPELLALAGGSQALLAAGGWFGFWRKYLLKSR